MITKCLCQSLLAVVIDKYNMKNLQAIASDLFNKIRGRFDAVTIGDEKGNVTNIPENARYFDFPFMQEGTDLGKVSVSLDEKEGVVVIVGRDLVQNQTEHTQDKWFNFLKELRIFAKKRMLPFDVRDINKTNLNKRDYSFLANNRSGDDTMAESKMYGTNKTSYQRIGGARLAIKHSAPINTESATGRTQRINAIFIESPTGERFKYPFKHLSGARAMARHVAEGGTAYDDFGKHIAGLSEEISKLRKFNQYMGRSAVMAETLAGYTDIVKGRVNEVKKEIQNLQKESYYKEAVANHVVAVVEDVPADVRENWIDQLTIKQFNEELADVFPYVYNLIGEATKADELEFEDIVAEGWETMKPIDKDKYQERPGLEGPIQTRAGKVIYYDPKEGQYYDPATDMYMDAADVKALDLPGTPMRNEDDWINSDKADDSSDKKEKKTSLGEYILSYFDKESGKFPKGETAILTAIQKDYGDQYVKPAAKFIRKVEATAMQERTVEVADARYPETEIVKHLAGLR